MARPAFHNTHTHKMNNEQLAQLTNHPHTIGVDGADYGPVRDELLSHLYARQQAESERAYAQFLQDQKDLFKHNAQAHKSAKAASITINA